MMARKSIEDRVDEKIHAWIKKTIMVCITATGSFLTFCLWLGGFIYDRFDAIKAAIHAYLASPK